MYTVYTTQLFTVYITLITVKLYWVETQACLLDKQILIQEIALFITGSTNDAYRLKAWFTI